jgi:L-lactate dehydrogenase complex protein LldG
MSEHREAMLRRIREAAAAGNRAGGSPPLPERGGVGYQGAGDDLVERFREEFTRAGGQLHVVADRAEVANTVAEFVRSRSIRRLLLGCGELLDSLPLVQLLHHAGVEVASPGLVEGSQRGTRFAAEMGVTEVDYLVAETGSVVVASRPEHPRSLSLLPPIHVAVAERRQLIADLFDLFELLGGEDLPACLSIITGPSKTGDIELRLVTGVHGPGEVHVVLVDPPDRGALK